MSSPTPRSRLAVLVVVAVLILAVVPVASPRVVLGQASSVVISQVYAGGQSSGAPLRSDYIELFNPGTVPVRLDGWSVQYAAATGTNWRGTTLAGAIPPGGFYLIREATGSSGADLPAPDAGGSLALATGSGRIALVSTASPLTCGADPG